MTNFSDKSVSHFIIIGLGLLVLAISFQNCGQSFRALEYTDTDLASLAAPTSEIHVDSKARSNGNGTLAAPVNNLPSALQLYRRLKSDNMALFPFSIILHGGRYVVTQPLELTASDSQMNAPLNFKSYDSVPVIISSAAIKKGAVAETLPTSNLRAWVFNTEAQLKVEDIFINGQPRPRAQTKPSDMITTSFVSDPLVNLDVTIKHFTISGGLLANEKNVEVIWTHEWMQHRCAVARAIAAPNNETFLEVTQHCIDSMNKAPNTSFSVADFKVRIENSIQLLDEAGEWFYEQESGKIYYLPFEGEEISTIEIALPRLTQLVKIKGSNGAKVEGVSLEGLIFEGTTVERSSASKSFLNYQATVYLSGEVYNTLPAAVEIEFANNVSIKNCVFRNLASTAVKADLAVQRLIINQNIFSHIGAAALEIGNINRQFYSAASESEVAVGPFHIVNNYFSETGEKFHSSPALFVPYARHGTISHNSIHRVPYTAISIGWGWGQTYLNHSKELQKNPSSILNSGHHTIESNKIDYFMNVMKDGGGIYTLDALPGTVIRRNVITNQLNEFGALYLDNCTRFVTASENVVANNHRTLIAKGYGNRLTNNYFQNRGLVNNLPDLWVDWTNSTYKEDIQCHQSEFFTEANVIANNQNISSIVSAPADIIETAGLEREFKNLNKLSAPSSLSFQCVGDNAVVSWDTSPGANEYLPRLDDPRNNSASCADGWLCSQTTDKMVSTKTAQYSFPILRNVDYRFWIHSKDIYNTISESAGLAIKCN